MRLFSRASLATGTALTLALGAPTAAYAQATYSFNMPAQDLGRALRTVARRTGANIVFDPASVHGRTAPALNGSFSAAQALQQLLAGSGLGARQTSGGSWVISPSGEAGAASAAADSESSDRDIIVTGSLIRGIPNVGAPVLTTNRSDFDRAGFTRTEEIFAKLPQNLNDITYESSELGQGQSSTALLNANQFATGINLRGLGTGSTLTLIDGTRRATVAAGSVVDVSAIPLSVIDRADIVTGGYSAIYGSDAVAGTVNLVTRRDYDGAESRIHYGFRDRSGGEDLQLSQMFGRRYARGGFVAAYDYAKAWPLDVSNVNVSRTIPSPLGQTPVPGQFDISGPSERHSAFAAGHFDPSDAFTIYANGLYSHQDIRSTLNYTTATGTSANSTQVNSDQFGMNGGLRWSISRSWDLDVRGGYSEARSTAHFVAANILDRRTLDLSRLYSASALIGGSLFSLPGGDARVAVGSEWRRETLRDDYVGVQNVARTVKSAYGQLYLPFTTQSSPVGAIAVTAAARIDHYSDFGTTTNPQIAASIEPTPGFRFQFSYSSAFRAPELGNKVLNTNGILALRTDPTAPGGRRASLILNGTNPNLNPETAHTWLAGVDLQPPSARWLRLRFSYFSISYRNRINSPALGSDALNFLLSPAKFSTVLNLAPTLADVTAVYDADTNHSIRSVGGLKFADTPAGILAAFPNVIIFDNRITNIGVESVQGIDISLNGDWEWGQNRLSFGTNIAYSLKHRLRITPTSPAIDAQDLVGKPASFRFRSDLNWTRGPLTASIFLNHVGGYRDTGVKPAADISAWNTVDTSLSFDFSRTRTSGALQGLVATLVANNIFGEQPPLILTEPYGINYDPANASVRGRGFSLNLRYRW